MTDGEFAAVMRRVGVSQINTVVDVGANEGQFLQEVVKAFSPRRVVAVEMLVDLAESLQRRYPEVDVVQAVVGGDRDTVYLQRCESTQASSVLSCTQEARELYDYHFKQQFAGTAKTRTLDSILASKSFESIDLLKIDVQGYELEVLRGARQTLSHTRSLVVECNCISVYEGGSTLFTVTAELEKHGFSPRYLFASYIDPRTSIVNHVDGLFLPR